MKIDGPGPVRNTVVRRAGKAGGGDAFARALADEQTATTGLGAPQPVAGVTSLLSLQEVEDSLSAPERAKARAEYLLDHLDRIRLALLSGGLTPDDVAALADTVASHRDGVTDPRLVEILDDIDLRAQVELAKLTRER